MNVRNCRKCGKIFNYIAGQPVCPSCKEELEKKFHEVKDYVQNNRDTSIPTVAKVCDVEESQIRQWVREERLVFAEDSAIGIECESCGALIRTGRYCDKCKLEVMNSLTQAGRRPEVNVQQRRDTRENPKMRFLDNH